MTIMQTARHLMAVLAPLTGPRSEGTITIKTRADVATLPIPLNYHLLPMKKVAATGNQALAPQLPFRTIEAVEATPAGVTVGVTSVLGGRIHNLESGTVFHEALKDNRIASIVATSSIAGASDYEGVGALKQVLMYEQIGSGEAQRNLFLAKLRKLPAAVLVWESSGSPEKVGPNKTKMLEQWTLHIVVSRLDSGELRALEGLDILDLASELLGRAVGIDGADFTNGDLSLTGRNRVVAADSAYIYGLRFQTSTTITKREVREFGEWLKTSYTLVTTPETELSPSRVTLVDGAVYDHPQDDEEP